VYILGTTGISGGTKTLPINAFLYLSHTLTEVEVETNGLDPRRRNTIPFICGLLGICRNLRLSSVTY